MATTTGTATSTVTAAAYPQDLRELINPTPRQEQFLAAVRDFDYVLYGGAAGGGKMLSLDTPIATPHGFVPLGDVRPGDWIMGRDGQPYTVIAESEVVDAMGWRLIFDDGASIVAHDEHEWLTLDAGELGALTRRTDAFRTRRQALRPSRVSGNKSERFSQALAARNAILGAARRLLPPEGTIRTTAQIVETLRTSRGRANHAIPVAAPLDLPERHFPLDPYLLGVWLGDGSKMEPAITTMDEEMVSAFTHAGFSVRNVIHKKNNRAKTYYFTDLRGVLRLIGVLGHKHVPHDYLWASEAQREALLAGLLDTDCGVVGFGAIEFVNTNRALTEAVAHLARSLGHKVSISEGRARLKGVDCGPKWKVKFTGHRILFRLPRKAVRQKVATRRTTHLRYIVDARRAETVRMKCLEVSAPDRLYLAGESLIPTHNSRILRWSLVRLLMGWARQGLPGVRVGLFCEDYPSLRERHLSKVAVEFPAWLGRMRQSVREFELQARWGGGVIAFRNLNDPAKYLSAEFAAIGVDELTRNPQEVFDRLRMRLRWPGIERPKFLAATNPGGIGHSYVKQLWVDRDFPPELAGLAGQFAFVPARASDNPHLPASYAAGLATLPEPLRRAYLEGDWDVFDGQVFCYDDKTELLTQTGWKLVRDVQVAEELATLTPSGQMMFAPATRVWRFWHEGEMYVHEGRAVDFSVTPGHRMWAYARQSRESFRSIPVEALPKTSVHLRSAEWRGEDEGRTVTIMAHDRAAQVDQTANTPRCVICGGAPGTPRFGMCEPCYRAWQRAGRPEDHELFRGMRLSAVAHFAKAKAYTFDRGDWCELLGWYLSEGFTQRASQAARNAGRIIGFGIAQTASKEKIARIRELLTRMSLKATFDGRRFRVSSSVLGAYLARFGDHSTKYIPRDMLTWERHHLLRLFEALMAGDGHAAAHGAFLYATVSKQLADDVQELCVRLNRVATITRVSPRLPTHRPAYRVSVYKAGHDRSIVRWRNVHREPYAGEVSCVTVEPHHTILIRRNGKAMWCGNSEWRRELHVCAPFAIPEHWPRYRAVDWGYASPFCCLWLAQSPATREVVVYREVYATQLRDEQQAALIVKSTAQGEAIARSLADPSMWAKRLDASYTAAEAYRRNGVPLSRASNERIAGWQRVHEFLAVDADTKRPRLRVFSTCANLIRTLPALVYDQTNVEDVDTDAEDHSPDCLRYALMALARPPLAKGSRPVRMGDGTPEPRQGPGADYPSDYIQRLGAAGARREMPLFGHERDGHALRADDQMDDTGGEG